MSRSQLSRPGIFAAAFVATIATSPAFALVGGAWIAPAVTQHFVVLILGPKNFCTGALIRSDLVLTAAQCVAAGVDYKVIGFDNSSRAVKSIVRHPQFDQEAASKRRATADLALLKLEGAMTGMFAPAPLAAANKPAKVGDRFLVAGYGVSLGEDTASGGTLRTAVLVVMDRPGNTQMRLVDPMTEGKRAGMGACRGDSGAPVIESSEGNRTQVTVAGIVTWSTGPDGSAGCGGLTGALSLPPYRDWIEKTATSMGSPLPPPRVAGPSQASRPIPKPPEQPRRDGPARISSGSGFFVTREGHFLTNLHVVEGCTRVSVNTIGMPAADAIVVARNGADDLAVLKTSVSPRQVASLRSVPAPRTGEPIIAFGFPLSGLLSSTGNATTGIISAVAGLLNDPRHLQISAPVQPGNSGGPLLDMRGNVVGIVVSKLDALRVARVTQDIPQNINFAIKASIAVNFLDAHAIAYSNDQAAKESSVPDLVEGAKAFSAEVKCQM